MEFDATYLSDHIGLKIENFDCFKKINGEELISLKTFIQEKHFICFKNQNLNEESLVNFTKTLVNWRVILKRIKQKVKLKYLMFQIFHQKVFI